MSSESAPSRPIIYLGMDVHKESITIAVLRAGAKAATRVDRLPNDLPSSSGTSTGSPATASWICYQASGAVYVLHRALREWRYACDVIAPR